MEFAFYLLLEMAKEIVSRYWLFVVAWLLLVVLGAFGLWVWWNIYWPHDHG